MDAETRGIIEKWIDNIIEVQDIPETVKLILREDYEVVSKEDLAVGYWLGYIMSTSVNAVQFNKVMRKFKESSERRRKKSDRELEKSMGKERFIEFLKQREEMEKKAKRIRPVRYRLDNEEDDNEIRRILLSKIKLFREKIRREPYR